MSIVEYLSTSQPTQKEMNNTPEQVRKYIRSLEKALVEHILKS